MSRSAANIPDVDPEEILEGIRRWVEIESPSHDGAAVNAMVDTVEEGLRGLGAAVERTPGRDGFGDLLKARAPWGGDGPGILVLSHLDTVHPVGSLDSYNPWRREGDAVYGPGIHDMKAGAYLAYYAYQHMVRMGKETPLPVTFLYVPEEEVGSPTSRRIIEAEARKNKYVLVTEPARTGGKVVTGRKGLGRFHAVTRGVAAHAGVAHENGRSAIREMAHLVLAVEAMTDYGLGVTINVGLVSGGTGANVVPHECRAEIDLRVPTQALADKYCARILGLTATDPDVQLEVTGGLNRPPFEKNDRIQALFDHARGICAEIGFELEDVRTGGGSDGNFTAALGIPTLDGLGACGEGAHAQHEKIYFSSLAPRAKMWIRLLETLA